jgi:hypothetical protein
MTVEIVDNFVDPNTDPLILFPTNNLPTERRKTQHRMTERRKTQQRMTERRMNERRIRHNVKKGPNNEWLYVEWLNVK